MLDFFESFAIIHPVDAGVAHPVERHLAKVEVASSSLVTRSRKENLCLKRQRFFFLTKSVLPDGINPTLLGEEDGFHFICEAEFIELRAISLFIQYNLYPKTDRYTTIPTEYNAVLQKPCRTAFLSVP